MGAVFHHLFNHLKRGQEDGDSLLEMWCDELAGERGEVPYLSGHSAALHRLRQVRCGKDALRAARLRLNAATSGSAKPIIGQH